MTQKSSGNSTPPRLVHVTTVPFALQAFFEGQIAYMKGRGFEVHGISSPGPGLEEFGELQQVAVHAVPMHRGFSPLFDVGGLARLVGLFRRLRPTLVHGHTPKGALLGMLAGWLTGVPVRIYQLHGTRHDTMGGWQRAVMIWTDRLSCRLAHRVLAISQATRAEALRAGFCPPEKIKILGQGSFNGVDAAERFNPERIGAEARAAKRTELGLPPEALVVGFVGRIVQDKGIAELATAWEMLREEFPELHLLMVGELEPYDPVAPEVMARLRADPRVHFTGLDWETPPLYACMDVLALPSHREGLGQVLLEAAAMGLPTVGSDLPACHEAVLDGETGRLMPPGDAGALAEALRGYLRDPELRRRHGAAGRARVLREFSPPALWAALYAEYAALLRARGVEPPT